MSIMTNPAPAPSSLTDEQIVERVRAGDVRLFEHVMRRNNARIYRAARAILRSDHEAEDVMQDAYVRAYEHLAEFDGRARFSTWLTRIAVHEAFARVRRARRHEPFDAETQESSMPSPAPHTPEQIASDGELRGALERAIDALPDDFRAVFVLRAVEEMSGAETAECLGIPEETVKTRLFRARGRLQEALLEQLGPAIKGAFDFQRPRCDRVVAGVLRRIGAA
jgi:RNA polymerase sigma-70 factor (ECF subfamily)